MYNLKSLPIWVCWNRTKFLETRNRAYKIPLNPKTGHNAKSNTPNTWGTYEQATTAAARMGNGVGFMFDPHSGICGIDIDVKGDPERDRQAQEILAHMGGYAERSPSGDGYHIVFTCDLSKIPQQNGKLDPAYYQKNPLNGIECYFAGLTNRYFTYTGDIVIDKPVTDQTTQVLEFLEKYMKKPQQPSKASGAIPLTTANAATTLPDSRQGVSNSITVSNLTDTAILEKARAAKNAKIFTALFDQGNLSAYKDDHSSADIALCNILAFYSGGDPTVIDRLFRQSALYRDKWEREDYRTATINDAIARCNGTFYKLPKTKRTPKTPSVLNVKAYPNANYFNPFETPENRQRYRWDDPGMGYLFADTYKNICRYVPEAKAWYVYDGRVWQLDLGGMVVAQQARDLMDYLLDCRKFIADDEVREAWIKFITARRTKKARDTMLSDAASVYPISILEFDKNPYLLNCENCTLDMKTRKQHSHNPNDFLSKIANVTFDKAAICDRWEEFIAEIMQGDMERAKFLQKALGYSLVGDTSLECFFILYGQTTRNGKGTTMETALHMLGGYGRTAQPETVAQKQTASGNAPSEDVARLKGARFVNMSEPDKGLRLNSALVKQLTGGDSVTARFLHQNSFEYRPEYKLFINTNHLPRVTDDSIFASGRVKLIPFERHFSENEQDKKLKALFKQPENLSGILNWFIKGYLLLKSEGLNQPQSVTDATDQYREESDVVGQFINECLVNMPRHKIPMKDVYPVYEAWCKEYNYGTLNKRNLIDELRRKKGKKAVAPSTGNQLYLFDYAIANHDEPPPDFTQHTTTN